MWIDGCKVKGKHIPELNVDEKILNDLDSIPAIVPCEQVKKYNGDTCIFCGKSILKDMLLSNPLYIRIYNPIKKIWNVYDVHPECMHESALVMEDVYKRHMKDRKEASKFIVDEYRRRHPTLFSFIKHKIKDYFNLNKSLKEEK